MFAGQLIIAANPAGMPVPTDEESIVYLTTKDRLVNWRNIPITLIDSGTCQPGSTAVVPRLSVGGKRWCRLSCAFVDRVRRDLTFCSWRPALDRGLLLSLSYLFVLFSLFSQPAQAVGFKTSVYFAGLGPNSIVAGDFNGDGKLDLAVADGCQTRLCDTFGVVTVLLGKGDGTFVGRKKFAAGPSGTSAVFVTAGDFNKDGKLDLLVLNESINITGDAAILLGNGDGTFQAPVLYDVAAGIPVWAGIADFNDDGVPDLAISDAASSSVAILLGNGDGTFSSPVNYPVGSTPHGLAISDLNRDGKLDLAVVNQSGTVSILLGNGDGTFSLRANPLVGIFPLNVAVADFNGDGHGDLVITLPCGTDGTCETNGGVAILLGNGDGTFQPPAVYIGTGENTNGVAVGDFDGDHRADVVALDFATNDITIFLGNGDGTLQAGLFFAIAGTPTGVVVADFNRDKRIDLVVSSDLNDNANVLLNTGR